jgi:hypothetical protein
VPPIVKLPTTIKGIDGLYVGFLDFKYFLLLLLVKNKKNKEKGSNK